MGIRVSCPECGGTNNHRNDSVGTLKKCRRCKCEYTVPQPQTPLITDSDVRLLASPLGCSCILFVFGMFFMACAGGFRSGGFSRFQGGPTQNVTLVPVPKVPEAVTSNTEAPWTENRGSGSEAAAKLETEISTEFARAEAAELARQRKSESEAEAGLSSLRRSAELEAERKEAAEKAVQMAKDAEVKAAAEVEAALAKQKAEKAAQAKIEAKEKHEHDAARKLDTAKKLKTENHDAYLRRLKELVEHFGDTKAGEEAATLLKEME